MSSKSVDLNSKEVLDLVSAARGGDGKALSRLVELLTPVVKAQVKRFYGMERDDLIQEGMFGVLEAVKNYDADKGTTFLTYVNYRVYHKLLDAVGETEEKPPMLIIDELNNISFDEKPYISVELSAFIDKRFTLLEKDTLHLYLLGYEYQQIADKLGKTVKSVDGTMQRVKKKLREFFDL